MKESLYIFLFLFLGLFVGYTLGIAQDTSRLCICFDEDAEYINISTNKDSSLFSFSIIREGFETEAEREKAREKAKKKWSKNKLIPYSLPAFTINFTSVRKPKKINSIKELKDCAAFSTLNEYRKENFKYPNGTGGSKVYFIQKLPNGSYLKWDAIMMAQK